jgi:histone deacetylase 1/2
LEYEDTVVVSHLSAEAELRAMALLTADVTWLRWLMEEFFVPTTTSSPFLWDSIGSINIADDPVKHELTKHIGFDASFVRTFVHDQVLAIQNVFFEL